MVCRARTTKKEDGGGDVGMLDGEGRGHVGTDIVVC